MEKEIKLVHYAPYGPYHDCSFQCGANAVIANGINLCNFTGNPELVTCIECKKLSPGLWPEFSES